MHFSKNVGLPISFFEKEIECMLASTPFFNMLCKQYEQWCKTGFEVTLCSLPPTLQYKGKVMKFLCFEENAVNGPFT